KCPPPTAQQLAHSRRKRTAGIQPLEDHQPHRHPGAQRPFPRKPRLAAQHLQNPTLGNRFPVALECPRRPRRGNDQFHFTDTDARFFAFSLHLLSYRILKHFPVFVFSLPQNGATRYMPLSGITQECVRHENHIRRASPSAPRSTLSSPSMAGCTSTRARDHGDI